MSLYHFFFCLLFLAAALRPDRRGFSLVLLAFPSPTELQLEAEQEVTITSDYKSGLDKFLKKGPLLKLNQMFCSRITVSHCVDDSLRLTSTGTGNRLGREMKRRQLGHRQLELANQNWLW